MRVSLFRFLSTFFVVFLPFPTSFSAGRFGLKEADLLRRIAVPRCSAAVFEEIALIAFPHLAIFPLWLKKKKEGAENEASSLLTKDRSPQVLVFL